MVNAKAPKELEAHNIHLVGYHDLNGKPAFKLAIQQVGKKWFLYVGHLWHRGWSILDVTDPYNPQLENFISGPAGTWTIQIQVADGKMITALEKPLPGWGFAEDAPFEEGIQIWDVKSDPVNPQLLGSFKTGGNGTHRNFYPGGRYLYLAANMKGFVGNILVVVDIKDPSQPQEIARWYAEEQEIGSAAQKATEPKFYFHGPIQIHANKGYLGYGRLGVVILDLADIQSPTLIDRVDFGDLGSVLGCHSVVLFPQRRLIVANSETMLPGSGDPLNYAFALDAKDETEKPRVISSFPLPAPTPGLQYGSYYMKGGRFGPHNQHHYQGREEHANLQNLVPVTYFNAGLRLFSIADPFVPKEVGYYVPQDPKERRGLLPKDKLVTQFEDVLVDSRGFIYCTDDNYGLFILRYDGELS